MLYRGLQSIPSNLQRSAATQPMAATPTLWPWESAKTPKVVPGTCWAGWTMVPPSFGLLQSRRDVVNRHEEQHLVLETLTRADGHVGPTVDARIDERVAVVRALCGHFPTEQIGKDLSRGVGMCALLCRGVRTHTRRRLKANSTLQPESLFEHDRPVSAHVGRRPMANAIGFAPPTGPPGRTLTMPVHSRTYVSDGGHPMRVHCLTTVPC